VVSHQRFISANSHFLFQYAIRPSVRGNKKFSRDTIIKTVADVVGPEHPVDLKNYDLVILVDVVQVRPWNALADQILIRVIRKMDVADCHDAERGGHECCRKRL
jgi:hypothetical protein